MECPRCNSLLGPSAKYVKGQSYCHVCRIKWHRCHNGTFVTIPNHRTKPLICWCEIKQSYQVANNTCSCAIS